MAQQTGSKSTPEGAAQTAATTASKAAPPAVDATQDTSQKKRKYSRGLKDVQRMERSTSRAAERLAQAVADGLGEYRKERDKSSRKKRDGAIRDAAKNVGRGLEAAITTAAKVPTDLTKNVSVRRIARVFVPPPFNGFLR